MLFHGVAITIFAIFCFQERDKFNVIEDMLKEVKINLDRFVCVVLYASVCVHRKVLSECVQFIPCTVREESFFCLNILCS